MFPTAGPMPTTNLQQRKILSIDDLTTEEIMQIHKIARKFDEDICASLPDRYDFLKGAVVYLLFDQHSTRTRESFKTAVESLGGTARPVDMSQSSMGKGESLIDNLIEYDNNEASAIVIRSKLDLKEAFKYVPWSKFFIPIINAGDTEEHPTQALGDSYLLVKQTRAEDISRLAINLLLIGHTKGYRAAHSLCKLLARLPSCRVSNLVPYGGEPMEERWGLRRDEISRMLFEMPTHAFRGDPMDEANLRLMRTWDKEELLRLSRAYARRVGHALRKRDFFYFGRSLRPQVVNEYGKPAIVHGINHMLVDHYAKPEAKIMHPRPRTEELSTEFDDTERDLYMRKEPKACIRARQALLTVTCGKYRGFPERVLENFPSNR